MEHLALFVPTLTLTTACLHGIKNLDGIVQPSKSSESYYLVLIVLQYNCSDIVHVLWMPLSKSSLNSLSIEVSITVFVLLFEEQNKRP